MSNEHAADNSTVGQDRSVSIREYASLERELESLKTEFANYRDAISAKMDGIKDEVRSSAQNPQGSGGEDGAPEENALPIQQITKIWKVGGTINANKTEHAAAIWSDFMDRSESGRDVYYLPSDKVEQILREHFRSDDRHLGVAENVKRATVHRAMDALEDLGGSMITSNIIKNGRRALMLNKDDFQEFHDALASVSGGVTGSDADGVTTAG